MEVWLISIQSFLSDSEFRYFSQVWGQIKTTTNMQVFVEEFFPGKFYFLIRTVQIDKFILVKFAC